ncbi:peptidase inhibitor family I36 protein [Streptomyces sp. NBC_01283]|uniref:peptidase inhibitor family I36 protein n=1 Tax=Streptomyces sp. NBC_01283 TaxID=2903812 RepID=UPI00352FD78E|nr:peptidase inhibitor family I36 protein [Streptomyces sp. NBC_01283]
MNRSLAASATAVAVLALSALTTSSAQADAASERLQKSIDEQIAEYGGTQVSDYAVAYDDGAVVVFPNPVTGEAPDNLGTGTRTAQAQSYDLDTNPNDNIGLRSAVQGCPSGWTPNSDWFCFYQYKNFKGKRWQFKDTSVGYAANWGFDNKTSSWVNNRSDWVIDTYRILDSKCRGKDSMFVMGHGKSSAVDSRVDNKLTAWKAQHVKNWPGCS